MREKCCTLITSRFLQLNTAFADRGSRLSLRPRELLEFLVLPYLGSHPPFCFGGALPPSPLLDRGRVEATLPRAELPVGDCRDDGDDSDDERDSRRAAKSRSS